MQKYENAKHSDVIRIYTQKTFVKQKICFWSCDVEIPKLDITNDNWDT